MVYRVDYHPDVEQDLFDIFLLVESYAGTAIARQKLDAFEKTFKMLAEFSFIGSTRSEQVSGVRVIPVGQKGVICFTTDIADRSVLILHVSYAGADWTARVKQRR